MKILILGDARHGKDTLAGLLQVEYKMTFESSSQAALRIFLFNVLKDKYGFNYKTIEEAFEDRVNYRDIWYNEILEYTKQSPNRLTIEILKDNDIYVGMRALSELKDAKKQGLFDLYLGIYDPRKKSEDRSSNTINTFEHSDIVLINNGTIEELYEKMLMLNIM